jgi:CBS domain-containing protein
MLPEDIRREEREVDEEALEGDQPAPSVGRGGEVGRQFLETRIRDLKPQAAVTIPEDASVARAIEIMRRRKLGAVLVVSKKRPRRLVGLFSERDLLNRALPLKGYGRLKVAKLMTRDPEALRPQDSCAYALNKMSVGRFRHIPLVDANHVPVGMLSIRDVIDFLVELIPEEILNLPAEPQYQFVKTQDGG